MLVAVDMWSSNRSFSLKDARVHKSMYLLPLVKPPTPHVLLVPFSWLAVGRPLRLPPDSRRYARGVEKARFPSELHDAMACLGVAEAHLSAQRLLHPGA